jgi:hypothetical protein
MLSYWSALRLLSNTISKKKARELVSYLIFAAVADVLLHISILSCITLSIATAIRAWLRHMALNLAFSHCALVLLLFLATVGVLQFEMIK